MNKAEITQKIAFHLYAQSLADYCKKGIEGDPLYHDVPAPAGLDMPLSCKGVNWAAWCEGAEVPQSALTIAEKLVDGFERLGMKVEVFLTKWAVVHELEVFQGVEEDDEFAVNEFSLKLTTAALGDGVGLWTDEKCPEDLRIYGVPSVEYCPLLW